MQALFPHRCVGLTIGLCVLALAFEVQAADTISLGSASAPPGADSVDVSVVVTNDQPYQGFSLALDYSVPHLVLQGLDFSGTIVETIVGGTGPEYAQLQVDNTVGEAVVGVIFDIDPGAAVEIPPTPAIPGNEVVRFVFDVDSGALPGDYPLVLTDGLGSPPVNNVLSSGGVSILPELNHGTFTVVNLYTFEVEDTNAAPGSQIDVTIRSSNETAVDAFTVAFVYEPAVLTLLSVASFPGDHFACTDLEMILAPDGIEFVDIFTEASVAPGLNWVGMAVVFDYVPPFNSQSLPVGDDRSIVRFPFQVANDPGLIGTSTTVDLTNDFPPSAPVANLVVIPPDFDGITPLLVDGDVSIVAGTQFKRGDSNSDGTANLADAIFVLTYLFSQPAPAPGCFDAADVNDDGGLDITDAIYFINFLFTLGCPPAAPFPGCGIDGNDGDLLDCTVYPSC